MSIRAIFMELKNTKRRYIAVSLPTESEKDGASCSIKRIVSMKGPGKLILEKARVTNVTLITIAMKENTRKVKLTEKEYTLGATERSTTANGETESKKAMESGTASSAILT